MQLPFGVFLDLRTNCKPARSLHIIRVGITSLLYCAYRCPTDELLLDVCPVDHARCNTLHTRIILIHPEHRLVLGRGPFQPKWRTGRSRVNIGLVMGLTPKA